MTNLTCQRDGFCVRENGHDGECSPNRQADHGSPRYEWMLRRALVLQRFGYSIELGDHLDNNTSQFEFLSDEWLREWYGHGFSDRDLQDELNAIDLLMSERCVSTRGDTFTRDELLAAMTLAPCHITGTHDPCHTPKYICTFQKKYALEGVLDLLGITASELPRKHHEYPPSGNRGILEEAWVQRHAITFTVSSLPGESWQEFGSAWEAGCDARKATQGKFTVYAMTDGLAEPEAVARW